MTLTCPTCGNPVLPIEIRVDLDHNKVIGRGRAVRLSPQQAELMQILWRAAPSTVRYSKLIASLYGLGDEPSDVQSVLRTVICQLRRKLRPLGIHIDTLHHVGYFVRVEAAHLREAA